MRQILTTLAEIAGATAVSVGVFLWSIPAGLVVAGGFAIAGGYLVGDE